MVGLLSKLFGKNSHEDDSNRKLDEIRNIVMNLESKGQCLNSDIIKGRNEIKQKRREYDQLLAEYESLTDVLEKKVVMAQLEAFEQDMSGIENRIASWTVALTNNSKLLQTSKRAYERLKSAIDQGCSMDELKELIKQAGEIGFVHDTGVGDIEKTAEGLDSPLTFTASTPNRDKVAEKLAKRAQAAQQAQPVPQVGQAPNDDIVSRPPTTPAI